MAVYQLHRDGSIWQYTGPPGSGWQELDNNVATNDIVADGAHLYQLHRDGSIWQYTGPPLAGWQELDNNPQCRALAASGGRLYQLHSDGSIWQYTGPPMAGWIQLDTNPLTTAIVADGGDLYQLHNDGSIWQYTGPPVSGWVQLDTNPRTTAIAASAGHLYQLHNDGSVFKYTGPPVSGWVELDTNPRTTAIVATDTDLYQLHNDGSIWQYTGPPVSGWVQLDTNPRTTAIVAAGPDLYQLHNDGSIFQFTGPPITGWLEIDANPQGSAIAAGTDSRRGTAYVAGAAVRDVTPTPAMIAAGNIWLWGYGDRTRACTGVREPLTTRAVAVRDEDGTTVVIATIDVGALDPAFTDRVKTRITNEFPALTPEYVCLNVSHTHGAPAVVQIPTWQLGVADPDPDYLSLLEDQVAGVILDALAVMRPAGLGWARGITDIGYDRHFGEPGFYDSVLDVVQVTGVDGDCIAVLFETPCHPVCLGDVDEVYADFPAAARSAIEDRYGGVALFLQGYAGTCNPSSDDDAAAGDTLGADVLAVLAGPVQKLTGPIDAWITSVAVPFQSLAPQTIESWSSWAQTQPDLSDPTSYSALISRWTKYMDSLQPAIPSSLVTPIQCLRIGAGLTGWYVMASGHEVVMNFAPQIRNARPDLAITTIGYSNSQLSYLPSTYVLLNPDERSAFPALSCSANYEGAYSFLWYGHPGPITVEVDNLFLNAHSNLLNDALD